MATSNTRECFTEFIGKRFIGVLFGVFPMNRADLSAGTKTLIFEDGRGLTIAATGSYWIEPAADVRRALDCRQAELRQAAAEIADSLRIAGAVPSADAAPEAFAS